MTSSRDQILSAIRQNQPEFSKLPDMELHQEAGVEIDLVSNFHSVATSVGSIVHRIKSLNEAEAIIRRNFKPESRIVSTIRELEGIAETQRFLNEQPFELQDIELAILRPHLAVAENGAVWLIEQGMGQRLLPFICQHLAVVISANDIVATMHQAYEVVNNHNYGYACFIAGPSKTADIEQSLVLGAHGPRTMTIFILDAKDS